MYHIQGCADERELVGSLSFNVTTYPMDKRNRLQKDVSFTIEPGQMVPSLDDWRRKVSKLNWFHVSLTHRQGLSKSVEDIPESEWKEPA